VDGLLEGTQPGRQRRSGPRRRGQPTLQDPLQTLPHAAAHTHAPQFACALSTVFRGDKDDVLDFWFRMYDTDR
jgi:hypothetical protein